MKLLATAGEESLVSALGRWKRHVDSVLTTAGALGSKKGARALLEAAGGEISLHSSWGLWARSLSTELDASSPDFSNITQLLLAANPDKGSLTFQWEYAARESLPAIVLEAIARYEATGPFTIEGTGISRWGNLNSGGSPWDLLQATDANRPAIDPTAGESGGPAVRFTRANADKLSTAAFTLNQPVTVLVKTKFAVLDNGATVVDGRTGNTRRIYLAGTQISTNAGLSGPSTTTGTMANVWYNLGAVFNGASSIVFRDASSTSGNAGTAAGSGLTVGDFGTAGGAALDGWIETILVYTRALSLPEVAAAFAWMDT